MVDKNFVVKNQKEPIKFLMASFFCFGLTLFDKITLTLFISF